ncbi:hypothetical protein B0H13DRAFT_2065128 [Mycena leptocephala]|nr:hypothetical protein B0H13DRAFT_2100190 [Mycena leptocephala]KAJ7867659.1 hypothetical protein B0H13DRAFT_2065128 [Mycena leptocephala]
MHVVHACKLRPAPLSSIILLSLICQAMSRSAPSQASPSRGALPLLDSARTPRTESHQLRDATLYWDAQFMLRGIYRRDAWPHRPGTESRSVHVCSSSLIHVQVRAAFPLPFQRARADDLVLQR